MVTLRWMLVAACFWSASLAQEPLCAAKCLNETLAEGITACRPTDIACLCADQTFLGQVGGCVTASCTVRESLTAQNATNTMCQVPVHDRTQIATIVTAVSGALAFVIVAMRLIDCLASRRVNWGDITAGVALAFGIPMAVFEFIIAHQGFGKDLWAIPLDTITPLFKSYFLAEIMYVCILGFTKMSILLFYLQVFPDQRLRYIIMGTLVFNISAFVALLFAVVFHCSPVEFTWAGWDGTQEGYCLNFNAIGWTHAVVNIALDLWAMALPIPSLWGLNTTTRRKMQLIIMFMLGGFIVRLSSLVRFSNTPNITYNNVDTNWMSVLEAYFSTICCCLPASRAVLRRLFPSCFSDSSSADEGRIRNYRRSSKSKSPAVSKLTPIRVTKSVTQKTSQARTSQARGDHDERGSTAGDSDIELVRTANMEVKRAEW